MKRIALILFFVVIVAIKAQPSIQGQDSVQETLTPGYWIDSSTGLMWTGRDNGNDISWGNAVKYCQNLRLAGYSDWRLPSVDELQNIFEGQRFYCTALEGLNTCTCVKSKERTASDRRSGVEQ